MSAPVVIGVIVIAAIAVGVGRELPELRRYMKMRSM
jgi:hypothetical protein